MIVFARGANLAKAMLAVGALLFAGAVAAQESQPSSKPILTVSGKIAAPNGDSVVQFDRDALEALGTVAIETTTPWYKGPVKFEGVPLQKLMQSVGASGERVVAVALN